MSDDLQVMRSIDKYDRLGDMGVFELLTGGRVDDSGAATPGVGMAGPQAAFIVGFLNAGRETPIARRFWLMERLESTVIDTATGRTAWDELLAMKPANIGWALDDLFASLVARLGADPRGSAGNARTIREMTQALVPTTGGAE